MLKEKRRNELKQFGGFGSAEEKGKLEKKTGNEAKRKIEK